MSRGSMPCGRDIAHRRSVARLIDFLPMDRRKFRSKARSAKQLIEIYPNSRAPVAIAGAFEQSVLQLASPHAGAVR